MCKGDFRLVNKGLIGGGGFLGVCWRDLSFSLLFGDFRALL